MQIEMRAAGAADQRESEEPSSLAAQEPLVLVTGASSNHVRTLHGALECVRRHEPDSRLIVYNLGLTQSEWAEVRDRNPSCEARVFDYAHYPRWVDIRVQRGQYAWKPIIVGEVAEEVSGLFFWFDSGVYIQRRLSALRAVVLRDGIYTPRSPGGLARWTHPKTLKALGVPDSWRGKSNRCGGIVAADTRRPHVMNLLQEWRRLALIKDCIAPRGSSRRNHRQDQSLLSILVHRYLERAEYPVTLEDRFLDFTAWNDIEDRSWWRGTSLLRRLGLR